MQEFKRILCPIDLSENSRSAVQLASGLARAFHAKLIFAYVGPSPLPPQAEHASIEMDELIQSYEKQLREIHPSEANVVVEYHVLQGAPCDTLLKFSEQNGCDLIVLSTHGRTGIKRLLMGSVAEQILRNASVPVLTVRFPD